MGNTLHCQANCCDKGTDYNPDSVISGDLGRSTIIKGRKEGADKIKFNANEILATDGK